MYINSRPDRARSGDTPTRNAAALNSCNAAVFAACDVGEEDEEAGSTMPPPAVGVPMRPPAMRVGVLEPPPPVTFTPLIPKPIAGIIIGSRGEVTPLLLTPPTMGETTLIRPCA